MMQARLPENKFFQPKLPCVPEMCAKCPFRPDGTGYAVQHPEFPEIVEAVAMGLPFICHETALMHPATKKLPNGDPVPGFQPHYKSCQGATLYKQGKLALSDIVVSYWAAASVGKRKRRSNKRKQKAKE